MAFVGIINEQEFYSQHYLDENLSGDIAGWVKEKEAKEKESREAFNKLTEAEKIGRDPNLEIERTPWSKLNSEAVKLLRRMNETQSIKDQRTKVEEEKSITARLKLMKEHREVSNFWVLTTLWKRLLKNLF